MELLESIAFSVNGIKSFTPFINRKRPTIGSILIFKSYIRDEVLWWKIYPIHSHLPPGGGCVKSKP